MLEKLLDIHIQHDDLLYIRRSRSLALLMLLLLGFSVVLACVTLVVTDSYTGLIASGMAALIFLTVYMINRSGRLALATILLLTGFCLIQITAAANNHSPLPAVFFPCLIVVIAAAFGSPRAPLIWAVVASAIPFVINLVLYRSIVPPAQSITPPGADALPLIALELILVVVFWMLAGISSLAARQLYTTIEEARTATRAAVEAQESLAAQQSDLAARNEQLSQARQELETLVSELTVPVVPVANGVGLLPLIGLLDASRSARIEHNALEVVAAQRMRALVIDLSGATGLQAASVEGLMRLCAALRLLGVTPILAGLGAQSALLLSDSNIALPRTVATVQDALTLLERQN